MTHKKSPKNIYLTHCCAQKDDTLKGTERTATPLQLYQEPYIQNFMNRCELMQVSWAIFSDLHGIWWPNIAHKWYDKHPDSVNPEEFSALVRNFEQELSPFKQVYFYYQNNTYHPFYDRLIMASTLYNKITKFDDLMLIKT